MGFYITCKYFNDFIKGLELNRQSASKRVAVTSNLAVTVIIFLKALPPTYRCMLIFNGVLTNMMTCRVYRNTKLVLSREENNTWHTTLDSIMQLDGLKVEGAALASKRHRAKTAGLWTVAILMLGFPFLCLYLSARP
jgi:hypothetical protein